jgi:Predicted membrane protein
MFALFVLLMDLPGAIQHSGSRMNWILAARETTFSIGALALFAASTMTRRPRTSRAIGEIARIWTGCVLVFYGIQHLLHPEFSPGVPDSMVTAAWVPVPHAIAYATGILLIGFGIAMFVKQYAASAAARCGLLMLLLTVALYVPQFFLARTVPERVTALNFVFDTLLFSGMMLVISGLCGLTWRRPESPTFRQTTAAPV